MKKINTVSQALRRIKELKGQIAQTSRRMGECVCWIEHQYKPLAEQTDVVWIPDETHELHPVRF